MRTQSRLYRTRAATLRRQRGLTLVETALVLGVAAITMLFFATMMADNADQIRAKAVAERMIEVHASAENYIKTHSIQLLEDAPSSGALVIPVGRPTATAAIPAGPNADLPSLQGGGFLPSGFVDRNGYNQRHALLVRKVTITSTGEEKLDAIVTTYGGSPLTDKQLQRVAAYMGASGGYVPDRPLSGDSNQIVGLYGGWRSPLSAWSAAGSSRPVTGSVVSTMAFQESAGLADYLYRIDIGVPEANQMHTAIDMGNNNINNAANVIANGNVEAGIDIFAERNIEARTGNITAPQGSVAAGVDVLAGRDVYADGNVRAAIDVAADNDVTAENNVEADNNIMAGRSISADLNPTDVANLRTGSVAGHDGTFYNLNSEARIYGSRWAYGEGPTLEEMLPRQVAQYSYVVRDNQTVPKPTCGVGGEPRIMIMRHQESFSREIIPNVTSRQGYVTGIEPFFVELADYIRASNYSNDLWLVNWYGDAAARTSTGAIAYKQAIAQTYCVY